MVCEIRTELVSAKKLAEGADLVAAVGGDAGAAAIIRRDVNILDRYPYTWRQVYDRLKAAVPAMSPKNLNDLIRRHDIKNKPEYAAYNFRSKLEQTRGPGAMTPVVYNHDFLRFAEGELRRNLQ